MSAAAEHLAPNSVTSVFAQWRHPPSIAPIYMQPSAANCGRRYAERQHGAPDHPARRACGPRDRRHCCRSHGSSPPRHVCAAKSKSTPSFTPARWRRKRARTRSSGMPLRTARSRTRLDSLAIASRPDANKPQASLNDGGCFPAGSGPDRQRDFRPAGLAGAIARLAVTDGRRVLGEVDIARSLRPALTVTAAVACGSCGLGLVMFLLLRVTPLRMLVARRRARFIPVRARPADGSAEPSVVP